MTLRLFFLGFFIAIGALAADKPNIIVILVDDMGFSDIGCYGSEIPTPNLDKLAAGGVRFTQFYNTARCCPTRASLLTGLWSHQAGIGHMVEDLGTPGYRGRLNDRCVTTAEVLRPAGYFTIMSGKWHAGQNHGVTPGNRGFDRSLNAAAGGFYYPDSPHTELFLNGETVGRRGGNIPEQWYSTDLWTDFGIKFIDEALAAKKPIYLHLCRNGPWELYNLKTDRTELHNLAAAEPVRVKELAAKWDAWAERAQVKPYPVKNGKAGNKKK